MKDPLKKLKKKELRMLLNEVLYQSVSSQYFGEEHKHRAHLWDITNTIDPKVSELISSGDDFSAYNIAAERAGYTL